MLFSFGVMIIDGNVSICFFSKKKLGQKKVLASTKLSVRFSLKLDIES